MHHPLSWLLMASVLLWRVKSKECLISEWRKSTIYAFIFLRRIILFVYLLVNNAKGCTPIWVCWDYTLRTCTGSCRRREAFHFMSNYIVSDFNTMAVSTRHPILIIKVDAEFYGYIQFRFLSDGISPFSLYTLPGYVSPLIPTLQDTPAF